MRLGDSVMERVDDRIRVAIGKLEGVLHGGDHSFGGAVGIFVATEDDRASGLAGAGRRDEFAENEFGKRRKAGSGCGADAEVANEVSPGDGQGEAPC